MARKKVGTFEPSPPKLDGHAEAHLVALCCSPPPEGRTRWTLKLLAQELGRLEVVLSVCPETVRRALKKNALQPWRTERFCIPESDRPRFITQMEEVLDVYTAKTSADEPLICMDEAAKQVVSDLIEPLPRGPGQPRREDHHDEREGTRAVFLFVDPLAGWRRVSSREHRTQVDWAEEIRTLLETDYPHARKVKLVCDNLNTHHIGSLYKAFPAEVAHRLARRLEIHDTPRNGSWRNMAEIELSVLSQQCLNRRFESVAQMESELAAWEAARNVEASRIEWRFMTEDARIKLRHLYPQPVILE